MDDFPKSGHPPEIEESKINEIQKPYASTWNITEI